MESQAPVEEQEERGFKQLNTNFVSESTNPILTLKQRSKRFDFVEEKLIKGKPSSE